MHDPHFWAGLAVVLTAWTAVASIISAKVKMPTSPKWKVIAYHFAVDLPSWVAAVEKSGILGRFNLPGLPSFTVDAPTTAKPDNAGPIKLGGGSLLMLLIPTLLASGCATAGMSAKAPLAVKLQADEAVMKKIVDDVKTQCGPQFASAAPIVAGILAIATNPTNALNDLTNAISMIPALVQDGKAMHCVYATVSADLKAAGFHAQCIDLDALQERLATIRQREIDQYARAYRRFVRLSAAAR